MYQDLNEIPIIKTIDCLWLQYKKISDDEYKLMEWWIITDWWTFNTKDNFVKDFSKSRWSWWNLNFLMEYMKMNKQEAITRFNEKWLLEKKKSMSDIWVWLPHLSEQQKQYLGARWIDAEKVKDFTRNYNWAIWCLIYEWDMPKWLNARTLSTHIRRIERRLAAIAGDPRERLRQGFDQGCGVRGCRVFARDGVHGRW